MTDRTPGRRPPMTPWRLEWLRLTRSRSGFAMLAAYVFFGLAGPVTARYMAEIAKRASSDVQIIAPAPRPAHGIVNFAGQAGQTGLIIAVVVAAAALCFDAHYGLAVFYRTRVPAPAGLIWPRFASSCALAITAYTLGTAIAWLETTVLIGRPPVVAVLAGIAFQAIYLIFAVTVVAAAATFARSTLATVGLAIGVLLLVLPIAGAAPRAGTWLPGKLATAPADLVNGASAGAYLRPMAVSVVAAAALFVLAVRRLRRRDL